MMLLLLLLSVCLYEYFKKLFFFFFPLFLCKCFSRRLYEQYFTISIEPMYAIDRYYMLARAIESKNIAQTGHVTFSSQFSFAIEGSQCEVRLNN